MKVLFLQPPIGSWVFWGKHRAINVSHVQMAACLREWFPQAKIKALDCRALDLDEKQMVKAIEEISPDLVYMGDAYQMTGTVAILPHYQRAARLIKEKLPDITICTGGFYIAANYKAVIEQTPEFDFVISGEQEITFSELCKELAKEDPNIPSIKGLTWRNNRKIELNEYRPLIQNLDELPMPAYDLFPMDKYLGYGTMPFYQEVFTSRGCPFGCGMCIDWVTVDPRGNNDWQRHRFKSAARVVDELQLLETKYGIKYVHIFDLNFNPVRRRVEEFLDEMLKRKLGIKYGFLGNAKSFLRDKDLLADLRKTGFVLGIFGLEVSDEETLKKIKKGTTVSEVREVVDRFRECGIMSVITWMVGFPDDDEAVIKKRFKALEEINPDCQSLQMLLPVKGIPLYDEFAPYVEEHDFKKWDFHHPVVRTKHLTREQLGKTAEWANREFYSKGGRAQNILDSKTLHPYSKEVFRSYLTSMDNYVKTAVDEEIIV